MSFSTDFSVFAGAGDSLPLQAARRLNPAIRAGVNFKKVIIKRAFSLISSPSCADFSGLQMRHLDTVGFGCCHALDGRLAILPESPSILQLKPNINPNRLVPGNKNYKKTDGG